MANPILTILFFVLLLYTMYKFLTQEGRPEQWWSFLPYKTRYITGYRYYLKKLVDMEHD